MHVYDIEMTMISELILTSDDSSSSMLILCWDQPLPREPAFSYTGACECRPFSKYTLSLAVSSPMPCICALNHRQWSPAIKLNRVSVYDKPAKKEFSAVSTRMDDFVWSNQEWYNFSVNQNSIPIPLGPKWIKNHDLSIWVARGLRAFSLMCHIKRKLRVKNSFGD